MPTKPFDIELKLRGDGSNTALAVHAGIAALGGSGTMKEEVSRFRNQLLLAGESRAPDRATTDASNSPVSIAEEIEKLHELKERGVIIQEEFDAGKRKLLDM